MIRFDLICGRAPSRLLAHATRRTAVHVKQRLILHFDLGTRVNSSCSFQRGTVSTIASVNGLTCLFAIFISTSLSSPGAVNHPDCLSRWSTSQPQKLTLCDVSTWPYSPISPNSTRPLCLLTGLLRRRQFAMDPGHNPRFCDLLLSGHVQRSPKLGRWWNSRYTTF